MKLKDVMELLNNDASVKVINQHGSVIEECGTKEGIWDRYLECEVLSLQPMLRSAADMTDVKAVLCISVDAYKQITVTFRTEYGYETFSEEKYYDYFDFDSDDELQDQIDDDAKEWLEDIRYSLENNLKIERDDE